MSGWFVRIVDDESEQRVVGSGVAALNPNPYQQCQYI